MIVNHLGYIFEGRKDFKDNIGVIESFDVVFSGNVQQVSLLLATDIKGNPLIPAYNDVSLGFMPLSNILNEQETADATILRFTKSNKPYFGAFGSFALLCEVKIKFDRDTGEVIGIPTVNFYAPKNTIPSLSALGKGDKPAVNCDRLSSSSGLNTIEVNEHLLNGYKQNVLKFITKENTKSRDLYLLARTTIKEEK